MTPLDPRDTIWLRRGEALGRLCLQTFAAIHRAFDHLCLKAQRTAEAKGLMNPAITRRDRRA